MGITLSGAEHGRFRPYREIAGGLYFEEDGQVVCKPCAVRLTTRRVAALCQDYARQYLAQRGDKTYLPGQFADWARFFLLHHVLIQVPASPEAPLVPLFPIKQLADKDGKVIPAAVHELPLHTLVDGQIAILEREYELLKSTQTPDRGLSPEQWEALITEGKTESLRTLHSRHGSSALIQVLHGLDGVQYPE